MKTIITAILIMIFLSEAKSQSNSFFQNDSTSIFYRPKNIYTEKNGVTDYFNTKTIVPQNNNTTIIYNNTNGVRDVFNYTKVERINNILYIIEYKNGIPDYFNKRRIE
jgi:hypothetical protein